MTWLVVVCAIWIGSLIVALVLGAFLRAGCGPTLRGMLLPERCLDCGRRLTDPGAPGICAAAHQRGAA